MENKKKYPYLAKNTINEKSYVVFFSEENYGTVVMSEITDNPDVMFGVIGDFDEDTFEVLPPDVRVIMSN